MSDDRPGKPKWSGKSKWGGKPPNKFGDKPPRKFGLPAGKPKPAWGAKAKPSFGDKPKPPWHDKGPRKFDDRPPRKFGDKPRWAGKPKPSWGDKPKPAWGDKPKFGDKPRPTWRDKPAGDKHWVGKPKPAWGDKNKQTWRDKASAGPRKFGDKPRWEGKPKPPWRDKAPGSDQSARPPRPEWKDRPPRKFDDRPPRKFGDKPRWEGKPKPPWRDKAPGADQSARPPRPEWKDRPPRKFDDRPPRKFGDKPRWEGKPKSFGDRPPRKFGDRPPRKFGDKPSGPPLPVIEVDAERMAPEGEALCRDKPGGRVVFVPYAVPGDRVAVEILQGKDTFAKGKLRRLITAGAERREPPCPLHFAPGRHGAACGGCDWQMLSYEGQLFNKREIVVDCLSRIAKIQDCTVEDIIPSPLEWGYRNKVQIPFGFDYHDRKVVAGFYAPGSHEIVDLEACAVQPELSVKIALKVKEYAKQNHWPVYEHRSGRGWLRHLFVRTNAEGKALVALVTTTPELPGREAYVNAMREAFPQIVSLQQNVQSRETSVVLGPKWIKLWGEQGLTEKIGPYTFFASPGAFLQVNTPAAEKLYEEALRAMQEDGKDFELVLDLYCGVGTLSVWLAKHFRKVLGVEEVYAAVHDARANAARNGIQNCRFLSGKAEVLLPDLRGELVPPSAVLVDPPRNGLAEPVLGFLTSSMIKRVVYVSCNPATFARDAGRLAQAGYKLRRVQPLDLFPQTSHVELVALLDRP